MVCSISVIADGNYYVKEQADYYLHGCEPRGRWYVPENEFGLVDGADIDNHAFLNLCEGWTPDRSDQIAKPNAKGVRAAGYDLTFSAPKSFSVLWATADEETRKAIEQCQQEAVRDALAYAQRFAAYSRRGTDGKGEADKVVLFGATFQHGEARPTGAMHEEARQDFRTDPQLHTHCVMMNVVQRPDGTWGAVDGKMLYWNKMALGAHYRASLSRLIEQRLGLECERLNEQGLFEARAVNQEVRDTFSNRRKEIVAEMAKHGISSAKASALADAVTVATREGKMGRDTRERFARWREEAAKIGFDANTIIAASSSIDELAKLAEERERFFQAKLSTFGNDLTETHSWVTEPEFRAAVAALCVANDRDATDAVGLADRLLSSTAFVTLGKAENGLYAISTPEMIRLEKELREIGRACETSGDQHTISEAKIDTYLARRIAANDPARPPLAVEQVAQLKAMLGIGGPVAMGQGGAGTGKSFVLQAAADIYREEGYRVFATASKWETALDLAKECHCEGKAAAKFLAEWQGKVKPGSSHPDSRTVYLFDELGQTGVREMHAFLSRLRREGGRMLGMGDLKQQLGAGAGPAMAILVQETGAIRLSTTRRMQATPQDYLEQIEGLAPQEAAAKLALLTPEEQDALMDGATKKALEDQGKVWARDAASAMADGKAADALAMYRDRGKLIWLDTMEDCVGASVGNWKKDVDQRLAGIRAALERGENPRIDGGSVVIVPTNALARAHSAEMREHLKDAGLIVGEEFELASIARNDEKFAMRIAVGEQVRFCHTIKDLGVTNGVLGRVEKVERAEDGSLNLTVRTDKGTLAFNTKQLIDKERDAELPCFEHAYAMTTFGSQGYTRWKAHTNIQAASKSNAVYVSISRAKYDTHIYVARNGVDTLIRSKLPLEERAGSFERKFTDEERFETLAEEAAKPQTKRCTLDFSETPVTQVERSNDDLTKARQEDAPVRSARETGRLAQAARPTTPELKEYMAARVEAGTLFRKMQVDGHTKADFEDHPDYQAFLDAQARRNDAARAVAADTRSIAALKAGKHVEPLEFGADLCMAEGAETRREANDGALDAAVRVGLVDPAETVEPEDEAVVQPPRKTDAERHADRFLAMAEAMAKERAESASAAHPTPAPAQRTPDEIAAAIMAEAEKLRTPQESPDVQEQARTENAASEQAIDGPSDREGLPSSLAGEDGLPELRGERLANYGGPGSASVLVPPEPACLLELYKTRPEIHPLRHSYPVADAGSAFDAPSMFDTPSMYEAPAPAPEPPTFEVGDRVSAVDRKTGERIEGVFAGMAGLRYKLEPADGGKVRQVEFRRWSLERAYQPEQHRAAWRRPADQRSVLLAAKRMAEKNIGGGEIELRRDGVGWYLSATKPSPSRDRLISGEIQRQVSIREAKSEAMKARPPGGIGEPTVLEWISLRGGLVDHGGELAHLDKRAFADWQKAHVGYPRVLRETGDTGPSLFGAPIYAHRLSLDETAQRAKDVDAGFLRNDFDVGAPELLERIRAELAGTPQYRLDHAPEAFDQGRDDHERRRYLEMKAEASGYTAEDITRMSEHELWEISTANSRTTEEVDAVAAVDIQYDINEYLGVDPLSLELDYDQTEFTRQQESAKLAGHGDEAVGVAPRPDPATRDLATDQRGAASRQGRAGVAREDIGPAVDEIPSAMPAAEEKVDARAETPAPTTTPAEAAVHTHPGQQQQEHGTMSAWTDESSKLAKMQPEERDTRLEQIKAAENWGNGQDPRSAKEIAAVRRDTHPLLLDELAREGDTTIQATVAGNPATHPTTLDHLGRSDAVISDGVESQSLAEMVARHPSTSEMTLDRLSRHDDTRVRLFVAQNKNTAPSTLAELAHDEGAVDEGSEQVSVKASVARNPNTPAEVRSKLERDDDIDVANAAQDARQDAEHEPFEPDEYDPEEAYERNQERANIAWAEANDEAEADSADAAYNPATSPERLEKLAGIGDRFGAPNYMKELVAGNPSANERTLTALAESTNPKVRAAVANNPRVPKDVLEKLAADKDKTVSLAAKEAEARAERRRIAEMERRARDTARANVGEDVHEEEAFAADTIGQGHENGQSMSLAGNRPREWTTEAEHAAQMRANQEERERRMGLGFADATAEARSPAREKTVGEQIADRVAELRKAGESASVDGYKRAEQADAATFNHPMSTPQEKQAAAIELMARAKALKEDAPEAAESIRSVGIFARDADQKIAQKEGVQQRQGARA